MQISKFLQNFLKHFRLRGTLIIMKNEGLAHMLLLKIVAACMWCSVVTSSAKAGHIARRLQSTGGSSEYGIF